VILPSDVWRKYLLRSQAVIWLHSVVCEAASSGPPALIRCSQAPDGVTVTTTTVDAHGKSSVTMFPAKYDGKPYPVNGLGEATAMALRKVDEKTAAITLTHAGNVIATAEQIISMDGNTMTITNKTLDPPEETASIYEKQ
jgi:uncharacterized protein YigE (DUF2233 family)